ncbi:GNAT family N-acetyltransferase [uncultured Alsobacter sp.]|uniref:GNAT family N-acetyltransferase n=1 Tax=uncultured Alsobacter sp. TaxID=1748258 RepID=UPI0025FDFC73|nr:GNAT family N-acetyltransferase [uncultured Alsobacter sp.]
MIRRAVHADVPRIREIRAAVRENRLRDPSRVTLEDILWFVDNPGIHLWVEAGEVLGFSAADPRDGNVWALFVDPDHEGRGIGRALLERAIAVLRDAGCRRAWLTTGNGTRAERLYLRSGFVMTGVADGELVLVREIGDEARTAASPGS